MLATYKEEELEFSIWGIDPTGVLWYKDLTLETADTPVTDNWVSTGIFWGNTYRDLLEFAQGARFTRIFDLFG